MTDTKCTAPKCDCDWPVCRKERSIVAVNSSRSLTAENLKLRDLCERLELEAKIHAGEARGANSTIREAYRAVTNGTGEPGNWNGAKLVIEALTALRAERDALKTKLDEAHSVIAPFAREYSSWGDTPEFTVGDLRRAYEFIEENK